MPFLPPLAPGGLFGDTYRLPAPEKYDEILVKSRGAEIVQST
jgi:hypothetical protein